LRALVTGGGGFVGGAIVRRLLADGWAVRSTSRGTYPALAALGVEQVQGDLADGGHIARALEECDTVFHVAALAGVWGPPRAYERANVLGTQRLVDACRAAGVTRLVLTSSPSVCFDGTDHVDASNDLPYARRFLAHYPASKAKAERAVLAANGTRVAGGGVLATCALRPHLVIGPGDPHLLPRLVERARVGRLAIVGRGDNEISVTDVENAAAAHVDAARSLAPGAPHAGHAYFVAQEDPVRLWPWLNGILEQLGHAPVTRRVPLALACAAGLACEAWWTLARRRDDPPMTRFVALQLATSHTYDMEPARRDFGYVERVPLADATRRAIDDLATRGHGV
jgi:nucleoside-diphosphate-sugar epimerase